MSLRTKTWLPVGYPTIPELDTSAGSYSNTLGFVPTTWLVSDLQAFARSKKLVLTFDASTSISTSDGSQSGSGGGTFTLTVDGAAFGCLSVASATGYLGVGIVTYSPSPASVPVAFTYGTPPTSHPFTLYTSGISLNILVAKAHDDAGLYFSIGGYINFSGFGFTQVYLSTGNAVVAANPSGEGTNYDTASFTLHVFDVDVLVTAYNYNTSFTTGDPTASPPTGYSQTSTVTVSNVTASVVDR